MSLPTPYYDDGKGIVIYHGDCREILPHLPKVDLVLKKSLKNSTEDATNITNETLRQRKDLGATESRNRMAVPRSKLVSGSDRLILSSVANRHDESTQEVRDSITRQGQGWSTERSLQGRNREHLLSASYPERQMFTMPLNDEACDSSQERESLGQPSGESASPLRELPQSTPQKTMVGHSQILLLTDPPYGISLDCKNEASGGIGRQSFDPVHGDSELFDPAPLLDFDDVILFGCNNYCHAIPPRIGQWYFWDKTLQNNRCRIAEGEFIWHKCGTKPRAFRHLWSGAYRDSESGISSLHPTQKPLALMKWCIELSRTSGVILDPYCGSGTTLRAAKDLGRQCIGIEISEAYCEIAARRLAQEVLPL